MLGAIALRMLLDNSCSRNLVVNCSNLFCSTRNGHLLKWISVFLDTQRNDRNNKQHASGTKTPGDGEVGHVRVLVVVHSKGTGCTG